MDKLNQLILDHGDLIKRLAQGLILGILIVAVIIPLSGTSFYTSKSANISKIYAAERIAAEASKFTSQDSILHLITEQTLYENNSLALQIKYDIWEDNKTSRF